MILADKIIEERKKNGWSQEELAEKLDVSRQSVSKWEGAQSTPDLQKILKMSQLFGVSTDYLLKDELEKTEYVEADNERNVRMISMEEANAFLALNKKLASGNALATALAIVSPICLLFLGGTVSADPNMGNIAIGLGMPVLIILIAVAVSIFIMNGMKLSKYDHLEKELIETAYGVSGMVKDRKEKYDGHYKMNIITGIMLCIIGAVSLFLIPLFGGTDMIGALMVCILLIFEAVGSFLLVKASCIRSGFDKLLQRDGYTPERKRDKALRIISRAYWLTAAAVYMVWSFMSNDWDITWIVWAAAGVMYPAVLGIIRLVNGT